jgi:hypothetical protein
MLPLSTSKQNHQKYIYLLHASNWQQSRWCVWQLFGKGHGNFVVIVDVGTLNVNTILSSNSLFDSWSSWREIRGRVCEGIDIPI